MAQQNRKKNKVLSNYNYFKNVFTIKMYFEVVPYSLRFYLSRIRLGILPLKIQTGRYSRNTQQRNKRCCPYCLSISVSEVEDEFHFVLKCPCCINFRRKYIPTFYYSSPSMYIRKLNKE